MAAQNTQEKEQRKSGLFFLEVGLLEICFVIVGLLLILGALNYFNFLSISKTIPFLSSLPTQKSTSPGNTTLQQGTISNQPKENITPTKPPAKRPAIYYTPAPASATDSASE